MNPRNIFQETIEAAGGDIKHLLHFLSEAPQGTTIYGGNLGVCLKTTPGSSIFANNEYLNNEPNDEEWDTETLRPAQQQWVCEDGNTYDSYDVADELFGTKIFKAEFRPINIITPSTNSVDDVKTIVCLEEPEQDGKLGKTNFDAAVNVIENTYDSGEAAQHLAGWGLLVDNYHNIDELYDYRYAYNALIFNEWERQGVYFSTQVNSSQ